MAVQHVIGGVEVEHDLLGWCCVGVEEQVGRRVRWWNRILLIRPRRALSGAEAGRALDPYRVDGAPVPWRDAVL